MTNRQTGDRGTHVADVLDTGCAGERAGNALAIADRTFHLLIAGPCPPAIDGRKVGHGLPARAIDLGELRTRLLDRAASDALKDAAWAELVWLARTGDPAWVVGCVGVALPGLKNIAGRVIRTSPARLADDIVSELLTEFVAQLARIDTGRPRIAARLLLWARKGAFRARGREARHVPCDPEEMPAGPAGCDADAVGVVVEAVRQEIISPAAASLIIATRLDGMSVQDFARERGVPADRLYKRRRAAEARLGAALRDGRVWAVTGDWISDPGL
ncbi:RNA polymerase sigma factor [Actinomadura keratinilytica]|uniref:RNA polymerase sigma factor n=1 Tax=Actinomadura keratinilytica TaxID=547461 RepID=UPI00361682D5